MLRILVRSQAEPERRLGTGHGTRDTGQVKMGGQGSCRAETAASSEWRVASSFSGGQCSCTAEKFFRRIGRCALQLRNLRLTGRFAFPNTELIRRLGKSVKSHVPCPVPLVPHWLKPVAWIGQLNDFLHPALSTPHILALSCTHALLHACTLAHISAKASGMKSF